MKRWLRPLLPHAIRPQRILTGPLRGTWLVTSWHDYAGGVTGRTERALLDWFRQRIQPGETWLDVGAHYGYTAFAMARLVESSGRVFTFEPVAATAGYMDRGRELNGFTQITVVPLGLGAAETLEIRRLPLTRGMADLTLPPRRRQPFVTVPVARFDWVWPLLHRGNPVIHGVKIDVQGMELDVLHGMRDALAEWHPHLVIELHAGVDRAAILSLLRELGYSDAAIAVDPLRDERTPRFLDDRSYAFNPR